MEHAGLDNYDDESEKKGLGTPATRAATIEGIIKHGYAQRKGKSIISTQRGQSLISVIPDEVKSPKLTSDWEMQLQKIERGEYSATSFMNNIIDFVRDLCSKYSSQAKSFKTKSESIGKCPHCGSEVKKGKYGFYCTGKCGMQLAKVYKKELTEVQLVNLLNGNKTTFISNGKKTIVYPEVQPYNYKTKDGREVRGFQWKTK